MQLINYETFDATQPINTDNKAINTALLTRSLISLLTLNEHNLELSAIDKANCPLRRIIEIMCK